MLDHWNGQIVSKGNDFYYTKGMSKESRKKHVFWLKPLKMVDKGRLKCIRMEIIPFVERTGGQKAMKKQYQLEDLMQIVCTLRGEKGCPWDQKQTHVSLRQGMIEESYEVVEAIDREDTVNLCEELGDVLLQVVFHAALEQEAGNFTMQEVIGGVCEKMIRRHPHVFGEKADGTTVFDKLAWEKQKAKEKGDITAKQAMEDIPKSMPALIRAVKVQEKAAMRSGIEKNWDTQKEEIHHALSNVLECGSENMEEKEKKMGEFLFYAVSLARFLQINPDFALTKVIETFINRFEYIENKAKMDS